MAGPVRQLLTTDSAPGFPEALTSADLAACLRLSEKSDPHPWPPSVWRRSLRDDHCLGIREGDQLIAVAVFSLVLDEVSLLNIVVDDHRRGRGLGRDLLASGLAWMQQFGAERCVLEVRVSNHPAKRVYAALGFREDGRRKNYYPLGAEREDALLMSVPLPLEHDHAGS